MFMLVLVFLGLAAAAPHYNHGYDRFSDIGEFHPSGSQFDTNRFFADLDLKFDRNQFWKDFELNFDQSQFWKNFESRFSQLDGHQTSITIVDDKYKVTIPLSGFEEKDIVVKARRGLLSVQAADDLGNTHMQIRTLPASVDDTAGVWTFENHVLTIEFPLKGSTTTSPEPAVTRDVEATTEDPNYSREEVEVNTDHKYDDQDADVGILTNEITKVPVEVATRAVNFKNEFVPVHYKK